MFPNPKNIQVWSSWLTIVLLVFGDWLSKTLVRTNLSPGNSISILGDILKITYFQNYVGFSWWVPELPSWSKVILQGLFLFVILAAYPVYLFYVNQRRHSFWVDLAFIGIVASLTGHLLNDWFLPYTVDFIQIYHSPCANFADIYSYVAINALIIEIVQINQSQNHNRTEFRQWAKERKTLIKEFIEYYRWRR